MLYAIILGIIIAVIWGIVESNRRKEQFKDRRKRMEENLDKDKTTDKKNN